MASIKLKAKIEDGVVEVKALIQHPMDTGLVKDKDGNFIPAKYITEVKISVNDELISDVTWSGSISQNPYIAVYYKDGKAGDKITLSWKDNQDGSDTLEHTLQ